MKKTCVAALCAAVVAGGCATTATPPKQPVRATCEQERTEIRDILTGRAVNGGWQVEESTETMVRLSKRDSGIGTAAIRSLAYGSSSNARVVHQWTIIKVQGKVQVSGHTWYEVQTGLGQGDRFDIDNDRYRQAAASALREIGCKTQA